VTAGTLAVPAVLTVWLAFNAGGFFAGEQAIVVLVLAVALAVGVLTAREPFAGLSVWAAVPAGALAALAGWALISSSWSDATGRALLEHQRPLAYALVLVLLAMTPVTEIRLRRLIRLMAAAFVIVAVSGLIARLLPDVWETGASFRPGRLSYPLTYWNAMGILAALGLLLCAHLACDDREPVLARALGAAASPALATTVLLTFSRGAILAGVLGAVVYLVLGRPRGLLAGVLAIVPASAIAVWVAYGADEITSDEPTSPAAVAEGHDLALVVGACVVAAGVVGGGLAVLGRRRFGREGRLAARLPAVSPRARAGALAGAALVAVVVALAAGAPGAVGDQVDEFWAGDVVPQSSSEGLRSRLSNVGNGGRREHWNVALDGFSDAPLHGQGAGTYALMWAQDRPNITAVVDAHSLYVETLGELGIVGLALVLLAVLAVAAGLLVRARGHMRTATAAVVAVWCAWAAHAGLDWDWEMTAVTLPVLALAGAALARPRSDPRLVGGGRTATVLRLATVGACAVLVVLPLQIRSSQDRLDTAFAALRERQCDAGAAADAVDTLPSRVEGWIAVGYCELLAGRTRSAAAAMRAAARRDPRNWEPLYGVALARAVAGADPRPTLRRALELNPREPITVEFLDEATERPRPRSWRALALRSGMVLPK
jgi:O-antigen ligase